MMNSMRKHTKTILWIVVGAFLGTIFFVWGMDLGRQQSNLEQVSAAVINNEAISQSDFAEKWEQQYRELMANGERELSQQETQEMRNDLMNSIIDNTLIKQRAAKLKIAATPQEVAARIGSMPTFKENGRFSREKYLSLLGYNRISPADFEAEQAENIRLLKMGQWLRESVLVTESEIHDYFRLRTRRLKLKLAAFHWENYLATITVSPDEITAYYNEHSEEFDQPEEVRASHILIHTNDKAGEEEKLTAKLKLDNLRADILKGADFAEVAKINSDDPGSKDQGGDLGWFRRDAMVKPFADAAFKLKINELSELVETSFGFHLIKVTGRHEAKKTTLAEARPQIEKKLKEQKARRLSQSAAVQFLQLAKKYHKLEQIAGQTKTSLLTTPWVTEDGKLAGIEDGAKILDQAFNLPLGKPSNPIMAGDGIYFVEVAEEQYQPENEKMFSLEHDSLLEKLKKIRGEQAVADWLKQARAESKITNNIAKETQEEETAEKNPETKTP